MTRTIGAYKRHTILYRDDEYEMTVAEFSEFYREHHQLEIPFDEFRHLFNVFVHKKKHGKPLTRCLKHLFSDYQIV